jgi:hypothetical protein
MKSTGIEKQRNGCQNMEFNLRKKLRKSPHANINDAGIIYICL